LEDIQEEKYHNELKHGISRFISRESHLGDEEIAYYLSKAAWELSEDDGMNDETLILIDSAIRLNPNPPANDYNRKAIMLNRNHRFKEALKYYDKALSKDESEETFLNNKAGCIQEELKMKLLFKRIEPQDLDLINNALKILPEGCDNRRIYSLKRKF
jgi:tetratricopeptide (TPR) repeat protein